MGNHGLFGFLCAVERLQGFVSSSTNYLKLIANVFAGLVIHRLATVATSNQLRLISLSFLHRRVTFSGFQS